MTYLQAISDGLRQEMRRDTRVFVSARTWASTAAPSRSRTASRRSSAPWRVIDVPLAETAILGGATGAALMGMRPIAEIQFADFVSCGWDHLVTVAAKQHYRIGTPVPIVVRLPSGGGFSGGPFHSQSPERAPSRTSPASRSSAPPRPRTRRACSPPRSTIQTLSSSSSTSTSTGGSRARCRRSACTVPFGKARIHRDGDDVTVVTWGAMVSRRPRQRSGSRRRTSRSRCSTSAP